jgi:hypothetical protein
MNTHAAMKLLLEMVFYTQFVQRGYKEANWGNPSNLRIEFCKEG